MDSGSVSVQKHLHFLQFHLLKSQGFFLFSHSMSLYRALEPWFIQNVQLWNSCRSLDTLTHLPALLSYLWVDKRLNPKFPMVTHAIRMLTVESSRVRSSNFLLLFRPQRRACGLYFIGYECLNEIEFFAMILFPWLFS